ncbi:hypothetical protein MTO96_018542 [Rhipicephalus appendiculatus]
MDVLQSITRLRNAKTPIANITMKFVSTTNTTRYNTVKSSVTIALHGYSLPAPHWRFLYVEENCTVVKVLSKKSPVERMTQKKQSPKLSKYCELWATQWHQWSTRACASHAGRAHRSHYEEESSRFCPPGPNLSAIHPVAGQDGESNAQP